MTGLNLGALLGGLGLFLLGMVLMTDGLKQAAGPALGRLLTSSTQTRGRGLLSGVLVTALVQSSSAVTVATIGFVNAGLLTLGQSLWVLFGANVGTTMTGWLVALIGLSIKVEVAALPLIGLGMALRLTGQASRRGALGSAVTGFGLLFLGIGFLQQAFTLDNASLDLSRLSGHGTGSTLAFVAAGIALTVLMQSSSAALAVALTLAQAGAAPLHESAAMVIGANIGTTATALLAAIGATPNAKRAAGAHVLFNALTGTVALLLLPLLVRSVEGMSRLLELDASPAISLALFHTVFNLLGVALMWPLTERLTVFLQSRFQTQEEALGQPRFLDRNVASVPSLAADALRRELLRLGSIAITSARVHFDQKAGMPAGTDPGHAYGTLTQAIHNFVAGVNRSSMPEDTAHRLASLLRVQHYFDTCHDIASSVAAQPRPALATPHALALTVESLSADANRLLTQLDPTVSAFAPLDTTQALAFENHYQATKAALLTAGAAAEIDIASMDMLIRRFSALRRVLEQAAKAARLLAEDAQSGTGSISATPGA